jgi:hypothetical protein
MGHVCNEGGKVILNLRQNKTKHVTINKIDRNTDSLKNVQNDKIENVAGSV